MAFLFELSAAAYPRTSTNVLPFNFTIDTRNVEVGSTSIFQYRLPTISTGTYDFSVSWGDGTSDNITSWNQSEVVHTYNFVGIYDIIISENISNGIDHISWAAQDGSTATTANDRKKLLNVKSWGPVKIYLSDKIFQNCENWYMTATDVPNFGSKDIPRGGNYQTFINNNSLVGDFTSWGTSGSPITGDFRQFAQGSDNPNINFHATIGLSSTNPPYAMDGVFQNSQFTGSISNWDISNVTSFNSLFAGNTVYNNPEIVNFNTSLITGMNSMFNGATSFNQDISGWDVSSVTDMRSMFLNASSFNQDISSWDVGSLTAMSYMFSGTSFNPDVSLWDVSNVTDFQRFIQSNTAFNADISNWDVSSASTYEFMFNLAPVFNQPIGNWTLSPTATSMRRMFQNSTSFNQSLSGWDVSNITNFTEVFTGATAFNGDVTTWDVSSGTTFFEMFENCSSFNQNIDSWNISGGSLYGMFKGCTNFNQPLTSWSSSISNVSTIDTIFFNATSFNQDISSWDVSNLTSMQRVFYNADAFDQDISSWDVSNVTNFTSMFYDCRDFDQDISNWNTSAATTFQDMFFRAGYNAPAGTGFNQNLGSWDISGVTNMSRMFRNVPNLSDENYSNILIGWAAQAPNIQSNVTLEANLTQYSGSIASSARNTLTGTYGWTILDAGDNGQ